MVKTSRLHPMVMSSQQGEEHDRIWFKCTVEVPQPM